MTWRARVARFLGLQTVPPPAVVSLRRYTDELVAAAQDLRTTAREAVRLEQRVAELEPEARAWERRLERARKLGDPEVLLVAARVCGRLDGRLQFARAELGELIDQEIALRQTVVELRRHWRGLVEHAEALGNDVSGCLLEIDLTRPTPEAGSGADEDAEEAFVARLIDGPALH